METTSPVGRTDGPSREPTRFRRWLYGGARGSLCARAYGAVLELAIGDGRNMDLYPEGVELTGTDIDDTALEVARERAAELGRSVTLRNGDPHVLPFAAESFDCVVCVLGLCRVADDAIVLAEARRVLRPGGTLLLLDHVVSTWPPVRGVQHAVELVLNSHRLTRRPSDVAELLGFEVVDRRRRRAGMVEQLVARKPEAIGD